MKCSVNTCGHSARWQPTVHVWPVGMRPKGIENAAFFVFENLFLCDECKVAFKIVEALPPKQWEKFKMLFRDMGLAEPDQNTCKVKFNMLKGASNALHDRH